MRLVRIDVFALDAELLQYGAKRASWNVSGVVGITAERLTDGLCQISWLPLPCRFSTHPSVRKFSAEL